MDLARACMVTRAATSTRSPTAIRGTCGSSIGGGLAFACIGVVPERRLLLESVYAFLTLGNGVRSVTC